MWQRARTDSTQALGFRGGWQLVRSLVLWVIAVLLLAEWNPQQLGDQLRLGLALAVGSTLVALGTYLAELALAPYRIERDMRKAVEAELETLREKHPDPDFSVATGPGSIMDSKYFVDTLNLSLGPMEQDSLIISFVPVRVTNRGERGISLRMGCTVEWKDGAETPALIYNWSAALREWLQQSWVLPELVFPVNVDPATTVSGQLTFLVNPLDIHEHGRIRNVSRWRLLLREEVSEMEAVFEPGEFSTRRKRD